MTIIDRFRLDGKVAVITGASSGLGRGFAQALSEAGAAVVLGARREDSLTEVAKGISAGGGAVVARRTDVTDPQDCAVLARAATDAYGRLDILVNNAGIGTAVPTLRETPEEFRGVIEVTLLGAFWRAQACARLMSPGSSIVNVASVLALVKSYAPQAAYAASKAALIGLTRDLSQQWTDRKGIRVNAIAPGYFESEMTAPPIRTSCRPSSTRRPQSSASAGSMNSTQPWCSSPVTPPPISLAPPWPSTVACLRTEPIRVEPISEKGFR